MARGIYTYYLDDKEYVLTKEQADAVDSQSEAMEDDDEFNNWFAQYARDNGIKAKADDSRAKYWSRVPYGYGYSAGVDKDYIRMATIQRAVTTLMRVVSPELKPGDVQFVAEAELSSVNLEDHNRVELPTKPIKGKDIYEDIDAVAGFGIHEAGHLKYTSKVLSKNIREVIYRGGIKGQIYNVLEDFRINELNRQDNPGFAHYTDETFDWIWDQHEYSMPEEWPQSSPEHTATKVAAEQLTALVAPIQYSNKIGQYNNLPYSDKIDAAKSIIEEYTARGTRANTSDLDSAYQKLMSLIDVVVDERAPVEMPMPVSIEGGMSGGDSDDKDGGHGGALNQEMSDEIAAIAASDMESDDLTGNEYARGASVFGDHATVISLRPENRNNTNSNVWKTVGKKNNYVLKADAELRLTKTHDRMEEFYQKSGDLNEDELYRLYMQDDRVFVNITEEVEEEAAVYLLVDVSSSMHGSRIRDAAQMAWLLAHSMSKKKHVRVKVFAHTDGATISGGPAYMNHGGVIVYRIYQKGESLDRLDWLLNVDMGGTPDSPAIAYVGRELEQEDVPSKYLIVLNDGSPGSYSNNLDNYRFNGYDEVRIIVDSLARKGVHAIQISCSQVLKPEIQAKMYKHYVPYTDFPTMIKGLARILDKVR